MTYYPYCYVAPTGREDFRQLYRKYVTQGSVQLRLGPGLTLCRLEDSPREIVREVPRAGLVWNYNGCLTLVILRVPLLVDICPDRPNIR